MNRKPIAVQEFVFRLLGIIVFVFVAYTSKATNPNYSSFLLNLSSPANTASEWDEYPEMVIEGNTIHLVWIEVSGGTGKLYYGRSLDLGKTWETPRVAAQIKQAVDNNRNPQTRKLAVDGENVHIAFCDMVSASNWASKIYYLRSVNGGNSFEPVKELASKGGDGSFAGCHIKAAKGKVAIAFRGTPNAKNGLFSLFSADNGSTFAEKLISTEPTHLTDMWFDGDQLIVMWQKDNSSASTGNVSVSISNDNAASFTTTNVSGSFGSRCLAYHDAHYSPKIAKSGNTIHLIMGNYSGSYNPVYVRSTNNGQTFEKAIDINNGALAAGQGQNYQETLVAKNGQVYIAYLSKGSKVFIAQSSDNGNTFSTAKNVMPDAVDWIQYTWYPSLVLDPSDATGKTVYLAGQSLFSAKSTDGGKSFSGYNRDFPLTGVSITHMASDLLIDKNGKKHWITSLKFFGGSDTDIFYLKQTEQPGPGTKNKALSVSNVRGGIQETVIVPSSPAINFEVAMTGEALVKILPGSENELSVFGKVNGKDASSSEPAGYQLAFHNYAGKRYLNAGIETDKGKFVNWTGAGISDTLWHHIAFTYDANAGLNNFKTYMDGLLVLEQTVTGSLKQGEGLLMIGSRSSFGGTNYYQIDNIRLWDRALTQEELMANQIRAFSGKEEGLKLFLNFDDTFKDISGNGNDANPLNHGILKNSNFNPPVPDFDLYQNLNQVTLTNKTQNGKAYKWSFGDGATSDKGNPVYIYPKAGEYKVLLEASNENSKAALIKKTVIAGLQKIEPSTAGNLGFASFIVYGGGINNKSTVKLVKGTEVILPDSTTFVKSGELNATFDLTGKVTGLWNVVVRINDADYTLKDALTIEGARILPPAVTVTGRGAVLSNRWQAQNIEINNSGNVDLSNVPLVIALSDRPGMEVEFINIEMVLSAYSEKLGHGYIKNTHQAYYIQKDYFKTPDGSSSSGGDARIYPLLIETLPQNSSMTVSVRVKSAESYELEAWTYDYAGANVLKSVSAAKRPDPFGNCLWETGKSALKDVAFEGLDMIVEIFPVGCAKSSYDAMNNAYQTAVNGNPKVRNTLWDLTSIAVNCGAYLTGAQGAWKAACTFVSVCMTGYNTFYNYKQCWDKFAPARLRTMVANSFDPNEMVGPSGYGAQNWIQKNSTIPYTILFENKSSATAPAHEVFITDSLDLRKYDFRDFGFGAFGFGDTILVPNGKQLRQFSMDVDLRPKMNLIARVSGKLDTISGIVRWEFTSLNPATLEYEEDPFTGFLPPNDSKSSGEGFVSFSVGLKNELKTGDVLKNKASIVFDANAPIITNEYINTLDTEKPASRVNALETTAKDYFTVAWSGTDVGSGIGAYTIYVLENDTLLRPWKLRTTETSSVFVGDVGSTYRFYSIAIDNVSLNENEPEGYDAFTTVTVDVEAFEMAKDELRVFPNPAHERFTVQLLNAPCGDYVVELRSLNGQLIVSELHDDFTLLSGLNLNVRGLNAGQYILRVIYGNKSENRILTIR